MDDIDRDIAELDAQIAEFRATPHKEPRVLTRGQRRTAAIKRLADPTYTNRFIPSRSTELQMSEYELVEPRVTVTLSHDLLRQIDTLRRQRDGFPSRAAIVREALTIGLPKLLPARIKREARP